MGNDGNLLKSHVSEISIKQICVKRIRVNQGVGVHYSINNQGCGWHEAEITQ